MKLLRAIPLLLFWLSPASRGALWAGDPPASPGLKQARLYIVASESMLPTVNKSDAIASMSIWIKLLGDMHGFQCESKIEIALSIGQIRQKLKEHAADVLVLDTPEYLSLAETRLVEAVAVGTSRGQLAAFPYLLLINEAREPRNSPGCAGSGSWSPPAPNRTWA